ncbi:MAG: CHRD domain-containing protein [Timaviella obliquedivisa GSE-PSE-MK23-08B]|jgi:hypothetical protein|nr:CHRD domain-containing protein [Timaviella obliquedivisa GSE-PSE-MK23-08B]
MEALETKPLDTHLDNHNHNSVGATDILSPVDSNSTANSSIGSSIQETELGQSLNAALGEPAAPTAPVAPVVVTEPEPQVAAQEAQALDQEQAPSEAQAPTANTPVGDSLESSADPSVANSLRLMTTESPTEALADVIPGLDPTTTAPQPADSDLQGFSVDNAPAVTDDHDHGNPGTAPQFHISLDDVSSAKGVNADATRQVRDLTRRFGAKGDLLDPGAGNNTVIGAGGNDLIFGNGAGLNTITTGGGSDTIVLGDETTNRIFDFNPDRDRFVLADGLDMSNIVIAQGKNPGKGGLNQPLDSVTNTLIIDKSDGHILASLAFVNSDTINESNFFRVSSTALDAAKNSQFSNTQEGSGQLTGGQGRDKLVGGEGDDFLAPGDDTFKFRTARSGEEFPFATDSPGSTRLNLDLKGGVLRVNGTYKNFDGAPLFSQGETTIDPTAVILNGAQAQPFLDGFLRVPEDVEGNQITGTHLHFSPAGDVRGNFADATVVRYFNNTSTSAKAGTITGEFELTPQEQAALLGGLFYVNTHTNVDLDGDGKGGFLTGENRTNFNKNVVRSA